MTPPFVDRFFDLRGRIVREVQLSLGEAEAYGWSFYRRELTRVRWDPELSFRIDVGDHMDRWLLDELQLMMNFEYPS